MDLVQLDQKYKRNAIFSKVKGSTMAPGRQENIKKLNQADKIFFVFEDSNQVDANAIKLYADDKLTLELGYVPKELAVDLRDFKRNGVDFEIRATSVTGNTKDKPTAGLNIIIILKR
jgi:hypothetical protein